MSEEQSSKEAVEQQLREDRDLIRRVFSSDDGQKLLQKWAALSEQCRRYRSSKTTQQVD